MLDPAGFDLLSTALSGRAQRPAAKELYGYLHQTVQARTGPPQVTEVDIEVRRWLRGQDLRINWLVAGASEAVITTGNRHRERVDARLHTTGYTIRPDVSGPVVVEFRNRFGAVTVDLGELRLYELPSFSVSPGAPALRRSVGRGQGKRPRRTPCSAALGRTPSAAHGAGPRDPGSHRNHGRRSAVSDFLACLGGADLDVLRRVPSARSRFVQMALVLLTTAGVAVVSMSFALHDGVKALWPVAILLGLLWGGVILNIDRFLVLSMGATRRTWPLVLMALPRLAMAALLSLAVSTPLVLRVFSSDIKAEVYSQQLQRSQQQATQISGSKESQEAAGLAKQIGQYQAVVDGHLPASVTSPALQQAQQQVAALTAQQQQAQNARDIAYEAWQCELYGAGPTCHAASNRAGAGPLAGAKQREFADAQAKLEVVTATLQQATGAQQAASRQVQAAQAGVLAAAQQDARSRLPALQTRYAALEADLQKISNQGTSVNFGDTGILAQLQALSKLSSQSTTLLAAHLVVMALFFLIEILPVTVKILLNLQPPTAYEIVAEAGDDDLVESVQARRTEARRVEEGKSRARLAVENDMRRREEALGTRGNRHVAAEQMRILDLALQEWKGQLRTQVDMDWSAADGPSRSSPSPTAPHRAAPVSTVVRTLNGRPWLPDPEDI